jgi:hypothetical protein
LSLPRTVYIFVQHSATRKERNSLRHMGRRSRIPGDMTPKDERIGIRISSELKRALLQIAKKEGRSLAQICDLFLRGGAQQYDKQGADFIYSLLTPPKEKNR